MTLKEIYTKIISDENLEKAFSEAKRNGKLAEFLAENECEASLEEAESFLISEQGKNGELADGELADDELNDVAGGGCGEAPGKEVNPRFCCEHFYCVKCHNNNPNCNLTRACYNCEHVWQSSDGTKTKCTKGAYDNVWWMPL